MAGGKVFLVVSGLVMVGCGAQKPASAETVAPAAKVEPGESAAPAATPYEPPPLPTDGAIKMLGLTGPDKPWNEMSYDEKEWYMVGKVHPIMRQVFQTFDAAKYEGEKFECTPCHDDDPERKYKMPNPKLSAIPAFGSEDWKAMENARIVKFMAHRVTPVMAQLLGEPTFDPATGKGFGCTDCHPKQ